MIHTEKILTIQAMRRFGGGFVSAFAQALARADDSNWTKAVAGFPDLFEKYGPGSHFYRAVLEEQQDLALLEEQQDLALSSAA